MRFLVLTKSSKYSGLCVAGIDLDTKKLIRLVSDETGTEIVASTFVYDGENIDILDIIDITCNPVPLVHQIENYKLETINKLECHCSLDFFNSLCQDIDNGNLLVSPYGAVSCGYEDMLDKSLMVVVVKNFRTINEPNINGVNKTKATFSYNGRSYSGFSITDPEFYNKDIEYECCRIVLSIPEKPYNDKYYIFIAKVFPIDKACNKNYA